jgi:hypothetical protein
MSKPKQNSDAPSPAKATSRRHTLNSGVRVGEVVELEGVAYTVVLSCHNEKNAQTYARTHKRYCYRTVRGVWCVLKVPEPAIRKWWED